MIVLGKNSSVYRSMQSSLPSHQAISHRDLCSLDISDELILVLSHPKNKFGYEKFLDDLNDLAKKNQLVLVSTSGLNGIQDRIRSKYFYLKSKREVEKLVLKENGKVIRCGAFFPPTGARGIWFVTSKNDFANIDYSQLPGISYLGHPVTFGSLNFIERISSWLLSKMSFVPKFEFIFVLLHILMFWTPNRGYTLASNQVFATRCSVGAGLSSLASRRLGFKFHIIPRSKDSKDDISKPWSQSLNRNGFGSRWHGVEPADAKVLEKPNGLFGIKIPLVPRGAFRLNILAIFWRYFHLNVTTGTECDGYVEMRGSASDGLEDVLACQAAVLNAGVLESARIISSIYNMGFEGVLGYHTLSSVFPARVKWKLIKKFSLFWHTKNALVLQSKQRKFLVIGRPPMSPAHEIDIVFRSTVARIVHILRYFDKKIIVWVLYSKFGIRLFNKSKMQLDLQISRSLNCRFDHGVVQFHEISPSEEYEKDLISSIQDSKLIDLDDRFEWIRRDLNALHVHFNHLDLKLEEIKDAAVEQGKIYLGSAGQLLNFDSPVHTSHHLFRAKLYRVKLTDS